MFPVPRLTVVYAVSVHVILRHNLNRYQKENRGQDSRIGIKSSTYGLLSHHYFSGHHDSNIGRFLLISRVLFRMVWLCLPLLLAVLSPCLIEAAWEDWNTGYGNVKWLFNCDFPGYDIGNQPSSGEDCGRICMDNKSCNHFSHKDGICYMKNVPIHVNRSPANGVVCGFRTCHDLYDIFSGHYCYNKG
ncbi:hypothetical protein OUZ56_030586 [Daphnia magna]|uniref:Apple domain-containing protein n=1 Tax=Daphnia magna TaxID=35525 RepID=A0ABQ9ZSA6_9CRUS|nr:hypothetical protein OUZ56_030586 [Daphnia magna]